MRARNFAQDGKIEVAIGVTSITGRGSGVVDLDWDRGWVFQLWGGRKWKSVSGLEANVGREGI
jgi:hypothetical protein